jgi:hypothetical protein
MLVERMMVPPIASATVANLVIAKKIKPSERVTIEAKKTQPEKS